jgi:hypothetical protein
MLFRAIISILVALLTLSGAAFGQNLVRLQGYWICQSGCTCSPASPQRHTSISPKKMAQYIARNECGSEANLTVSNGRVVANDWGLTATVTPNYQTIQWSNGTIWKRDFPQSALESGMAYWESRVFYCSLEVAAFPSKEDGSGEPLCDDGDSVMFNALLCRAADPRGCNTVKRSQDDSGDDNGRFWRSPKKRLLRPDEPPQLEYDKGQTTFSGDHATGLFVYFGLTRDAEAFRRWIRWINFNGTCLKFCPLNAKQGWPRYCKHDNCTFREGDCQIFLLLGERLNVGVPFCTHDPIDPVPTVTNVAHMLRDAYDRLVLGPPLQPPADLKLLRDNFEKVLKAYEDVIEPIEQLRVKLEALAVRSLLLAQLDQTLAADFNKRGFPRHNAMVRIMMLEDWDLHMDIMNGAARNVANDEPLNPFFQYVAHRHLTKASMLPLIVGDIVKKQEGACPIDYMTDHPHIRYQWSWERDSTEKAWINTMYRDCLFIAAMYNEKQLPLAPLEESEGSLRARLDQTIKAAEELRKNAEAALKRLTDLIPTTRHPPLPPIPSRVPPPPPPPPIPSHLPIHLPPPPFHL